MPASSRRAGPPRGDGVQALLVRGLRAPPARTERSDWSDEYGASGRSDSPGRSPALGRGPSWVRGFTLLEVLLVIGVIGLLTSVLVVGGARMLSTQPVSAEEIFWRAVSEAREFALLHACEVRLSYDRESRSFRAQTPFGAETFPVPFEGDLEIDFLSSQRGGNTVLIGGALVENQPLPWVTFFDDGTCTPFRAQLRSGPSEPQVIAIDPWTCAPILTEEKS